MDIHTDANTQGYRRRQTHTHTHTVTPQAPTAWTQVASAGPMGAGVCAGVGGGMANWIDGWLVVGWMDEEMERNPVHYG